MPKTPVRTAIIGCGFISEVYSQTLDSSPTVELIACADLQPSRAAERASATRSAVARTVDEVLADPDIELVVNLTVPQAHHTVTAAALDAGKSVFSEKPLALDAAEAAQLIALADRRGVLLGCAPDTFMGPGPQTALALLQAGVVGTPIHASAALCYPGPDAWHPDPAFLFRTGSGPLFDVGPYFITTLVAALGPIRAVSGACRRPRDKRQVGTGPLAGTWFPVTVPTHAVALLEFEEGAIATLMTSFDVGTPYTSTLELHGTHGSLKMPDPNGFDGPVLVRRGPEADWEPIEHAVGIDGTTRGVGAIDLASALRAGELPRASAALAQHTLEVLAAVETSSATGQRVPINTRCNRPSLLAAALQAVQT